MLVTSAELFEIVRASLAAPPVARCDGRYPVPQASPPREEPFDITYRCALPTGHDGPHGDAASPVAEEQTPPIERAELIRRCMAASYDERLSDGMLYRQAAEALAEEPATLARLREAPLTVTLQDERVVIAVGIDTLAHCWMTGPERDRLRWDDLTNDYDPNIARIVEPQTFAEDVVRELKREQEDGTTPVHLLFDKAMLEAVEQGSLGVDDVEEDEPPDSERGAS
jgi:hypothetical protein